MESDIPPYYSLRGKNIVLATDGKPNTERAMWVAMDLAKLMRSKLFVLLVIDPSGPEDRKEQIRAGKKRLNTIVDLATDQGVDVTALMEGGPPKETIIHATERLGAGTLVVGTSEKSRLDRVLIGSVSEHVVRNCDCTVIVVK